MSDQKNAEGTLTERRSHSRRQLLKALTVGGGAIAAGAVLPENWVKPVVDQVIIPVHADATGARTLTPHVVVSELDGDFEDGGEDTEVSSDNIDGTGSGADGPWSFGPGTHSIIQGDDSMMFEMTGNINPGVAQSVSVNVVNTGGDMTLLADLPLSPVVSNGAGAFTFPTIGTDDIPDNIAETVTMTFSTAGAPNAVIVINFSSGQGG